LEKLKETEPPAREFRRRQEIEEGQALEELRAACLAASMRRHREVTDAALRGSAL